MQRKHPVSFLLAAIFFVLSIDYAVAQNGPFMGVLGRTSIPIGHYDFCKRHSSECNVKTDGDVRVYLSEANWLDLVRINSEVNQSITYTTDQELYGKLEFWTYPNDGKGDVEDYVLQKRKLLIEAGWPEAALLITVALTKDGEGHALLTVRTDRGDLVLDALESEVKLWSDTEYIFVKRQSENHSGKWVDIIDSKAQN